MTIDLERVNAGNNPNPGQAAPGQPGAPGAGTPPAGPTPPAEGQVQGEVRTLDGGAQLAKMADGSFRLTLVPDDPDSSTYVGKTEEEVWANLAKGKAETDRTLAELRGRGEEEEDEDVDIAVPDEQKLRLDLAARNGIDPKFLGFTEEQWNEYERDHSAAGTWNIMQKVEAIKQAAHQQVARVQDQHELLELNSNMVDEETESVVAMLSDYGIDPDAFEATYRQVIKQVTSDDRSYKGGVLRPGIITAKAAAAMRTQITKSDKERLEREIAEKNRQLREAGAGGSSAGAFNQGAPHHASSEDAMNYILTHPGEFNRQ